MTQRPFAAFDIDGTILRWQLYHAVADELSKRGLLDPEQYQSVRDARLSWKKRKHQASYSEYELILVKFFDEAILKLTPAELKSASEAVIETYKEQVYAYTRDLIAELKLKNYLLFAISASHEVIVKMLAGYYGFDDAAGSVYLEKDGRFTGKSLILKSDSKVKILNDFVKKHNATWNGSIAVGDSESDIAMLSAAQQPIAFNPSKELFEHAKQHNWPVVVERKNVVYNLEPSHGTYKIS